MSIPIKGLPWLTKHDRNVPAATLKGAQSRWLMTPAHQLKAVGFGEVTMLSKPSEPANALESGPPVAAA
jgi:hypothetical protein